jgi:hypothetical protein
MCLLDQKTTVNPQGEQLMNATRNSNWIVWTLGLVVVASLLTFGCDDSTTSSDPVGVAEIELSFSPDPVNAQASTNAEYQWMASFTLTISETAGTGGDIDSLSANLYESAGGIIINGGENDQVQISTDAESNRVEASSNATVDFNCFYTLPGGGHEALVTVTIRFIDDNGYVTDGTVEVSVN